MVLFIETMASYTFFQQSNYQFVTSALHLISIAGVETLNAAQDKFRAKKEKEAAGDSANSAKSDDAEDDPNVSSVEKTASTETTADDDEDGVDGDHAEGEKETEGSTSIEGLDVMEAMSNEAKLDRANVWQDSMDLASSFESTKFGNSSAGNNVCQTMDDL